ncbi:porin [Ruegeria atlantica]|uniref:Porin n=1 Tax=Ruegeria atlantica TaxID=81569 RepID=A0A0P1F7T8_9RHOB|nr:porin [Ruegeria atlantica]CUH50456.1 Porin [Ruegeria atlantica]
MKKVLFATTALIATASVAAADVRFSGYGRFGIGYQEDRRGTVDNFVTDPATGEISRGTGDDAEATVDTDNTILVSRFRLNIDGNTETDGGVEFSARVRLQADEDSGNGEQNSAGLNGARFSVIYGGLRVDAGNVSGAFDNLANYYGNEPGLESFVGQYSGVDYSFLGYSSTGSGSNAVFFQYAVGDFAFGASYDQATVALDGVAQDADRWDISATYSFANITAALAYGQTKANVNSASEKQSLTVLTLGAEFGDFSGTVFVADDDVVADDLNGTAYGLSLAYTFGAATTVTFAYGDGSADDDTRNLGVGVIYDLGGGASLRGGIGEAKTGDQDGSYRADFGAQFNF